MAITVRQGTKHNPNAKGFYRLEATGDDVRKMRGSEIVKQIKEKGALGIEKQMEEQRQGEDVMYPGGRRLRMGSNQAENAINFMRRRLPKGPPATKTMVTIGARIVTMPDGSKRIVRDYEER